jgi:hypothetical protein
MPSIDIMPLWGRPVNSQTLPGSVAEQKYRNSAEQLDGILDSSHRREDRSGTQLNDLMYRGGKTIPNLTFTNFYVGGDAWEDGDIENIDRALAGAVCEPSLNNVMAQYFNTVPTSRFVQSQKLDVPITSPFSQDDAEEIVRRLKMDGKLSGFDLNCTAINFLTPPGVVISLGISNSHEGLGGYHGSVQVDDVTIYYAVNVYSEAADGQTNGIPVFDAPWKNVVATAYHHLNEIRTDPDVGIVIKEGLDSLLGWMSPQGQECGDFPIFTADPLSAVFQEVPVGGGQTAPVQFMYSNYVHGPEGPISDPHPSLLQQIDVSDSSKPHSAITGEERDQSTWVFSEGDKIPGDFALDFVEGYEPTAKEKECLNRINNCVTDLLGIVDDGTARGQQLITNRDADLRLLRECVQKLVAGEMTTESLLFITYKYEGKVEEWRASLGNSKFTVAGSPIHKRATC